jgi:hypothetical protein
VRHSNATALLLLALILGACSLAQQPTLRPTLAPLPTPGPDATAPPTALPCAPAQPGTGPATPAGSPGPGGVVALDAFPAADAFEVTDVVWTGSRFVAVGFGGLSGDDYYGRRQGVVWTSCDGLAWQAVVEPALTYVTPTAVAALGEDVFILGVLATCAADFEVECEDVAEAGNVILRSTAGGPWQRLPQAPDLQVAYDVIMRSVGGRLAAYGTADDEELRFTLWWSGDGVSWQATTDLAGMDPIDSLASRDGGFVAFGSAYSDELEDAYLVAASSADGTRFAQTSAPDVPGAAITGIAAGPAGFVGVGVGYPDAEDFGQLAVALFSSDGQTWSTATASDGSFGDAALDHAHALESGYIGVGFSVDADDFTAQTARLWQSPDGQTWTSLAEFGGGASQYVASAMGPGGLVLFSTEQEETDDDLSSSIGAYFVPATELAP